MKNGTWIIVASVFVVLLWWGLPRIIPSSIDYQGQRIKLSKFYFSYEDYKDDPDNIDASETARVQRLVEQAPIAHSFPTLKEAVEAAFEIKFPGYGAGGMGPRNENGDLAGFVVEIPRSEKSRYFVFRKTSAGYVLIDDFVDSSMPGINHIEEMSGNLVYSMDGRPERLVHAIHTRQ